MLQSADGRRLQVRERGICYIATALLSPVTHEVTAMRYRGPKPSTSTDSDPHNTSKTRAKMPYMLRAVF